MCVCVGREGERISPPASSYSPGQAGLWAPRRVARAGGQPGAAGGEGRGAGRERGRQGEREGETEGGRSLRAQAEPPFPFPGRRAPSAFSCGGGRWPRGAAAGGAGPGTEERLNFLEVEEPR